MPKLEKTNELYAQFERICPHIKGKRNLSAKDVATAIVNAVAGEIALAASSAKEPQNCEALDWFMDDKQRELRIKIRDLIQPCITAAKNYQNSYLVDSGLMPKVESVKEAGADFV